MKEIYFITGNKGKFKESQKKFEQIDIKVIQKDIGYTEIQANSLESVALYGIKEIENKLKEPFFLEDAGLFIDSLNGFPGVYSSYVYQTIRCKGILDILNENKNRNAKFKSCIAYKEPKIKPIIFIGECKGSISLKQKGSNGFGYDPIFIPKNENKTFAEMETFEKNHFSHRGKSLEQLMTFIKNKL